MKKVASVLPAVSRTVLEYDIFGEGSQVSTNQKRECTVLSLLIGWNLRLFLENTILYHPPIRKLELTGSAHPL